MNTSEGTPGVETHCLSAYDLGGREFILDLRIVFQFTPPYSFLLLVKERKDTNCTVLTKIMLHSLEQSKKLSHLITKTDLLPQSLQK